MVWIEVRSHDNLGGHLGLDLLVIVLRLALGVTVLQLLSAFASGVAPLGEEDLLELLILHQKVEAVIQVSRLLFEAGQKELWAVLALHLCKGCLEAGQVFPGFEVEAEAEGLTEMVQRGLQEGHLVPVVGLQALSGCVWLVDEVRVEVQELDPALMAQCADKVHRVVSVDARDDACQLRHLEQVVDLLQIRWISDGIGEPKLDWVQQEGWPMSFELLFDIIKDDALVAADMGVEALKGTRVVVDDRTESLADSSRTTPLARCEPSLSAEAVDAHRCAGTIAEQVEHILVLTKPVGVPSH